MKAIDRQREIIDLLVEYGCVKVDFLTEYFSVCKRTILRDIQELSFSYPIYTISGRNKPGIYISEDYKPGNKFITDDEATVLRELMKYANAGQREVVEQIISKLSIKRQAI